MRALRRRVLALDQRYPPDCAAIRCEENYSVRQAAKKSLLFSNRALGLYGSACA